jgi:hypothetical protein
MGVGLGHVALDRDRSGGGDQAGEAIGEGGDSHQVPFGLSSSKPFISSHRRQEEGFDRLSPNGFFPP